MSEQKRSNTAASGNAGLPAGRSGTDRLGDVRGQYATVVRMTANLDRTGALTATD